MAYILKNGSQAHGPANKEIKTHLTVNSDENTNTIFISFCLYINIALTTILLSITKIKFLGAALKINLHI